MNQYEAMFVFDPTFGGSFENCEAEIRRFMERAGAEILFCNKWEERRLAYKIKGRKRGVYVLVYFRSQPDRIAGVQRDVQLSENALRVLVMRADGVTPEMMERQVAVGSRDAENGAAAEQRKDVPPKPAPVEPPGKPDLAEHVAPEPTVTETAVAEMPDSGEPASDDEPAGTVD